MGGQEGKDRVSAGLRGLRRFLVEAVLLVGLMLIYWVMRGAVPERAADALNRANHIVHIEEKLGIFVELRWQAHIIGNRALVDLANWIYLYGHLPLLILAAIWIYVKNRERYRIYRNALLISAGIGLVIYQFFPVAPPRLMPQLGFVDTIALFNNNSNEIQP
ncbi:MAG: phosphatase PAP2 family protein, partial [Dehalococcoidia bacterium]